ncbi:MAG: acyl carrier protein [Eubacteriales bacterium]
MYDTLRDMLVSDLQVDEADITPEAELQNDLGINSLELADLVLACEEKFNIEIKDEDIHNFVTVNDVVNYLEKVAG